MSEPGTSTLGSDRLQVGRVTPLDPDFARVRAIVEMRMLGDDVAPMKIGRFTLLERIAEGGMGVVFSAFDAELDRKIAVKLLRGDRDDDPVVRQRIVREAQAMAKLSHPNVAHVYEVGEHDGRTFIAMEFIRGTTLRAWAGAPARSWRDVVGAYMQAGRGLAAAHGVGLVHRDFKPDNALVGDDARVRVLDFGLARVEAGMPSESDEVTHTAAAEAITRTGSIMGTPAYMAPEQLAGTTVDAKSDQFAFCVALWEALFGERPFAGHNRVTLGENVTKGIVREPPRDSSVPAWVRAVVRRGLSVAPAERFASMDALLLALADDPSRRRRRVLALGGAITVVAIVGGGFAFDRDRRERACDRAAASISDIWNDEARARMGEAILSTEASYAADTWARVEPRLDTYAAQWSETRASTCYQATVARSRTGELARRTDECLAERRDAFASFVEVTSAPSPPLHGAVRGVASLPNIGSCTADGWLLQRPTPPTDAAERERATLLDRELTRNHALVMATRIDEGLARAQQLALETEALGWAPLHARALAEIGTFATDKGDLELATAKLEEAAGLALRSGADELATDAMSRLVTAITISGKDFDRALWWGWLAQTVLDRSGEIDPIRQIDVLVHMGGLHLQRSEYEDAESAYGRALEIAEVTLGTDHPIYLGAIDGLAHAMIERRRVDDAVALLHPAIERLSASLGPNHPDVADLWSTLGIAESTRDDSKSAADAYAHALAIQEAAYGPMHFRVANTVKNLAQEYEDLGKTEEATAGFERAIAIIEHLYGPDSPKLADPLMARGVGASKRGEHAVALVDYRRALAIKEAALGPDHMHVGYIRINVAGSAYYAGDAALAVREYEKALAIVEPKRGADDTITVMIRKDLAIAKLAVGEPQAAIELSRSALASCARVECPAHKRATMYMTLAKSEQALGRPAVALEHMRAAKAEILKSDVREDLAEIDAWLAAHAG